MSDVDDPQAARAEIQRLRRELEALRAALGVQSAIGELAAVFDTLVAAVDTQRLAVPLQQVVEVLPRVLLSPLPEAPPHVAGYMRWRGVHVPVVDMGLQLQGRPLPVQLEDRIVVIRRSASELRGLLVSEVEGVVRMQREQLSPVRPDAPGAAWALGFVQREDSAVLLVSLDRLLDPLAHLETPGPAMASS
jgi:chemotaxis signal transduction protein